MKKHLKCLALLTFILAACNVPSKPIPIVDGIQSCPIAETHLKALKCIPTDKPYTVKGKSFTLFCQETMLNGIDLHPGCLAQITACDQMNTCVQK